MTFFEKFSKQVKANTYYRRPLYTDDRIQIYAMALLPGETIDREIHEVTQTFHILVGSAIFILRKPDEDHALASTFGEDGLVIVSPGTEHEVVAGPEGAKILTIYAPKEHLDPKDEPKKKVYS